VTKDGSSCARWPEDKLRKLGMQFGGQAFFEQTIRELVAAAG